MRASIDALPFPSIARVQPRRLFSKLWLLPCLALMVAGPAGAGDEVIGDEDHPRANSVVAETEWLSQVEKNLRDLEYHVTWRGASPGKNSELSWQVSNPAQGFHAAFTEAGIRVAPQPLNEKAGWELQMTLAGIGRDARALEIGSPHLVAEGPRLEYLRGNVTEWYANGPKGLEQGFTLQGPPDIKARPGRFVAGARRGDTKGEVWVSLTFDGSLWASVSTDGQVVDFAPRSGGMTVLHYGKLEVRDAKDRKLPSWMEGFTEAGRRGIRIVVDDSDAVYPVTIDPLLTSASWTAEPDERLNAFGWSVSGAGDLNGDGFDDVIVGRRRLDSGVEWGGAFVYHGSPSGLETTPAWIALELDEASNYFGWSVSTAGDVNCDGYDDVIINAHRHEADDRGAVFVFYGSPTGLVDCGVGHCTRDDADWMAEGVQANEYFGWVVSTAGNVNGDVNAGTGSGCDDVIVGADLAAFVFHGSPTGLPDCGGAVCTSADADWNVESAAPGTLFGISVAGAGDLNRDGFDDIIIGAPSDPNNENEGAAYVFHGASSGLADCGGSTCTSDDADWVAESNDNYNVLGIAVAAAGDVNGDGYDDVLIGVGGNNTSLPYEGRAVVFHGPLQHKTCGEIQSGESTCLPTDADWVATGDHGASFFGRTASGAGDVNGDGYDDVIIGSYRYTGEAENEGQVKVFEGSPSGLGAAHAWSAEGDLIHCQFGQSVSSSGDVNGDGRDDVLVGSPYFSGGQWQEGRAWVFHGAPTVTEWMLASHLGLRPQEIGTSRWEIQSGTAPDASLPVTATPEAVSYGPIPGSLLITTGRVTDRSSEWRYPDRETGILDVDWGGDDQADTAIFELELHTPSWARTVRFTSQYLTNELGAEHGDPYDSDSARFKFYSNGWSVDEYPLDEAPRWVVNPPVSHVLAVTGGQQITLVFTVEDVDGSEDSGLVLSRLFFSELPIPSDITLEHDGVDGNGDGVVDYFANASPHDVSLSSGTYTYSRDLLTIPGLAMPFRFAIVYNSRADRVGSLGRKWTHSYDGQVTEIWTDEDGNGTSELDTLLVRHGAGTAEYFEPDGAGGYRAKFPGTRAKLTGQRGDFTLTTKQHLVYRFTQVGDEPEVTLLTSVTDVNGNTFGLSYAPQDGKMKVDSVQDTRGETIDFVYTGERLTSVEYQPDIDTTFRVRFTYALTTNDLASFADLEGQTTTFDYDDVGNLLAVIGPDGRHSVANSYEQYQGIDLLQVGDRVVSRRSAKNEDPYDPEQGLIYSYDGEALSQTDRLGHEDTRYFDVKGRMARRIDPAGVQWEYGFDHRGNIIETRRKLPDEVWPRTISIAEYDDAGNLVASTEFPQSCIGGPAQGASCDTDADCPGSSCGLHQSMTYDLHEKPRATTDHYGNTTTFGYDAHQNLVTVSDSLGYTIVNTYDAAGRHAAVTDPAGRTSCTAVYDSVLDQPTTVYNPVDADLDGTLDHVRYTYDSMGRRTTVTDPNGNTTTFAYDENGRILSETGANNKTTEYTYDSAGRPLTIRESNGAVVGMTYTPTGRLLEETDAMGAVTRYGYDEEDRLISIRDPLDRLTTYAYDSRGRVTRVEMCDPGATRCLGVDAGYDHVGNLARITDAKAQTTLFEYDQLGRVTREVNEAGDSVSHAYDARGLMVSSTNGRGQVVTHDYDEAGRQTRTSFGGGSITHAYDANGNPISSLSDRYVSVTRSFDAMDRIVDRSDEFGNTIRFEYDPAGNLRVLTYTDGSKVVYGYDVLNRLVRVEDWYDPATPPPTPPVVGACESSSACRLATYSYDDVSNLTGMVRPDGSLLNYAYDLAHRLTGVSDLSSGATTIFAATYTLDPAGQPRATRVTVPLDPQLAPVAQDFGYNELNQIVSRGADSFAYDADGNLTSGVIDGAPATLSYDESNRMTGFNDASFLYDVDGQRVQVTRAAEIRRFVYDPTAELSRLLEEHDESGQLVSRYVYGLGLISRGGPSEQDYRVYHFDRRGSTVALTDASGTVTDVYAYDPYGAPAGYEDRTQGDGATPNPFRYNGRDGVIDDGNGLYYMRARYYSPELMRFIQQDVAPVGVTDPQTPNRYAFANGNPIQFVDPDGYWFGLDDAIVIIGGALAGAAAQGIECAISGDGCGWEDFVGATVGGALGGAVLLYTGNPLAAGAAGAFVDASLTNGLKAIPGGQDTSWEQSGMEILSQTVVGGALGSFGKAPVWKSVGKFNTLKSTGRAALTGVFGDKAMRSAFVKGVTKVTAKTLATKAIGGGVSGLGKRYSPFGAGGDSGGVGAGGSRGSRPPGAVWNQYSNPQADAWAGSGQRGCLEHAWR